jgi:hypothetical protein
MENSGDKPPSTGPEAPTQSMSLRLAAEQQQEGGSKELRDNLIRQALDEGHSVNDVAEALTLTPQAIYRVQERLQKEEGGQFLGAGADLRATAAALEAFTDAPGFERLVQALIGDLEPAAIPLGGSGDRGRDAANVDSSTIFTISLAQQWQRKVRSDLARIAESGFSPRRVFAVTNRRTARRSVEKLAAEAAKSGIELTVLDQSWLVAKLSEPRHQDLREVYLGLAPPRNPAFLDANEYRMLLDGRPHLAGMTVSFVGRDRELQRAKDSLESDGVVLLCGGGGMGKTRLALRLAESDDGEWRFIDADMQAGPEAIPGELPVSSRLVIVIDNAHNRGDLRSLVSALERLRRKPRVVLVSRPGYEQQISAALAATWLGPLGGAQTVYVGPLRWEPMARLLKAPPLAIESGAQRGEIVRLAEGNPQIAVIAARVAKQRRSIVGLSGDELLQRYIAYLVPSAIPAGSDMSRQRTLLALLAALDGIETNDEELLAELGGALRIPPELVEEGLEHLAESGLAVRERGRYRIKPDLLAEHVLFALTLSEKWQLAIDYRTVFEHFGETRLDRLVKALGSLPAGLFEEEGGARLVGVEAAVRTAVRSGPVDRAAGLVRDLCPALPAFAQQLALELLDRIRASGEPLPESVVEGLRDGAMRIADFPKSWRLLLRLGAECAGRQGASEKIGEAMADTYQRLPEGDASRGMVLAWVQETLAEETERFWSRRREGAASAVALALRPMLTLSFETHRASPDNPMALEIGGRILPGSEYTERVVASGGRLAAAVFRELGAAEQLKLLETGGWAAHVAAGFPASMGRRAPLAGRVMLDRALVGLDVVLAEDLERLGMPVRAVAYGHLLKRSSYRRKLASELQGEEAGESAPADSSVKVPTPSEELAEYIFLIHNGTVGPTVAERGTIREEHERKLARAADLAAALAGDPRWRQRLDRWSDWWRRRSELESEPMLGPTPAMVFDGLARGDAELGADAIDHLIESESGLRDTLAIAMGWVVRAGLEQRWRRWLGADPQSRATLASALANCDEDVAGDAMRELAFDQDASVRRAARSALAFSAEFDRWRFDLALEAVADDPDVEAIGRLLHMADHRAEEAGGGEHELDRRQRELVRDAVLRTAAAPRLEGYRLADALQRAARDLPPLAMEWVWARLEALDEMRDSRQDLRAWDLDFLPDELEPLVREAGTEADLSRACRYFAELTDRSPALPDCAKLIGWLGGGAEDVSQLLVSLLADGETASRARSYLMELPLSPAELDRRAETIADALEEPSRSLLELIEGTQPSSWSGSYVPHLKEAMVHAERWAASSRPAMRAAGREAIDVYRRRIESEQASEEAEDFEFEYR